MAGEAPKPVGRERLALPAVKGSRAERLDAHSGSFDPRVSGRKGVAISPNR